MTLTFSPRRSLKTRVTLYSLAIFVAGIWSLAFYGKGKFHRDLQRLLGNQQYSTVAVVAGEIDSDVRDRLLALKSVADSIPLATMRDAAALRTLLAGHPVLALQFNAGVAVHSADGRELAALPRRATAATGITAADAAVNDAVATMIARGGVTIGRPILDSTARAAVFSMAVPIHDGAGRVVGALSGTTTLAKPSFLDRISAAHYGKTGAYFLASPQERLIIASSRSSRVMARLPGPGVVSWFDRVTAGFEGSEVYVNQFGVEVLASAKRVPSAGWIVSSSLATTEAFSPIVTLQRRMLLVTIVLTLLAGGLMWWMLSLELTPLMDTVHSLATVLDADDLPQTLPVVRRDEIGQLIGGFNGLLRTLHGREAALMEVQLIARLGSYDFDISRDIWSSSPTLDAIFGIGEDNPRSMAAWLGIVHPADREQMIAYFGTLIATRGRFDREYRIVRASDGAERWVLGLGELEFGADGAPRRLLGTIQDITERKLVEEALEENREKYRGLSEGASEAIFISEGGLCLEQNGQAEELFGYSAKEALGRPGTDWIVPADRDTLRGYMLAGVETPYETTGLRKDGSTFPVLARGRMMRFKGRSVRVTTMSDITRQKAGEAALQATLREKDALLKEVHHRVKNNLQVITSLLRLESGRSTLAATKSVLTDMQGRIHAMALLHETLYGSRTFAAVELAEYLRKLATQAFRAASANPGAVRLRLELTAGHVGMDQAMTCGLLVNELVSNALKHGFPDGRSGEVCVELHPVDSGTQLRLRVSDTGVGLSADFEQQRVSALGLQLVSDLTRQLGGSLDVGPSPAAVFAVTFTPDAPGAPS
jgi:PAS domain S-box-containing protein